MQKEQLHLIIAKKATRWTDKIDKVWHMHWIILYIGICGLLTKTYISTPLM